MLSRSVHIPESELSISYARSGGPGGQNVNKVETKAIVRWNIDRSTIVTHEEKIRLKIKLYSKLVGGRELIVTASETRSREQNRKAAIKRLQETVKKALVVKMKRHATKPTRTSQENRLSRKKKQSQIKAARRSFWD